jgi:hypothetical protein
MPAQHQEQVGVVFKAVKLVWLCQELSMLRNVMLLNDPRLVDSLSRVRQPTLSWL